MMKKILPRSEFSQLSFKIFSAKYYRNTNSVTVFYCGLFCSDSRKIVLKSLLGLFFRENVGFLTSDFRQTFFYLSETFVIMSSSLK